MAGRVMSWAMKGALNTRISVAGSAATIQNQGRRVAPDQNTERTPIRAKMAMEAMKGGIGGAPGSPARGRAKPDDEVDHGRHKDPIPHTEDGHGKGASQLRMIRLNHRTFFSGHGHVLLLLNCRRRRACCGERSRRRSVSLWFELLR